MGQAKVRAIKQEQETAEADARPVAGPLMARAQVYFDEWLKGRAMLEGLQTQWDIESFVGDKAAADEVKSKVGIAQARLKKIQLLVDREPDVVRGIFARSCEQAEAKWREEREPKTPESGEQIKPEGGAPALSE